MPLDCVPISELSPAIGLCKINVRILRIWGFPKKDKPAEFSAVDLLLLDAKGSRIQASIKPIFMERFKDKLHEESCYELMNFDLGPNVGQFRGCAHPYKISFQFYTVIKPCEELPNTEFRYNFCPFPEIIEKKNDGSVFIDIIGEVVAMNEIKEVSTVDGKAKLLNLQLKDLGDSTLDVALWGHIGETVYSNLKSQKTGPVVFLGSLMKTMPYLGKGTAQSSKFSTKVFINPSTPETTEFTQALCNGDPDTSMTIVPVQTSFSGQVSKKSFAVSEMKTISELLAVNKDTTCNILATIVSIDTSSSWYYTGCSFCFKTVTPYFNPNTEEIEPDKYSCDKCDKPITTTQTRFKLKLHVMDDTGTTSFISFDDVVIPLIKKSAYILLEEQVQFNRSGQTPPELVDLIGRQFVFKILATKSEKFNSSFTYRVVGLTDAIDVIESFSGGIKSLTDGALELSSSSAPSVETTSQAVRVVELKTASAPSMETTSQDVEIPQAITVSGSSVGTEPKSSIKSSELDNLDTSGPDVNHPTPTSKRSLRHPRDEVVQQSSTKPKLMYSVKKEKK